ncbi:MAG TPA: WD40 repeat domain-containing protein [Bacteroidia bacterium]|jgi:Tol biopolymer transport system component|nr:WD40 repeat domain-containing protein [Bacteroidia bacterium]
MRKLLYIIPFLAFSCAFAQLPETEIFLADIEITNKLIKVEKTENITNRKGYDNQPFFMPDGKTILFSSGPDSAKKIHIWQYTFKSKEIKPETFIQTSEYSPMLAPDGRYMSCVVVEKDSAQRIWLYDIRKTDIKSCLTENTDSIGYYAWLGKDSILYYKLTNPHSLRVLNLKTGEDNWLCNHPTRSFKKVNNTTFFYVIHEEKENFIYFFDIHTKKAQVYAVDKPENQDYVWLPDLGMVKSEGSKLLHYSTETKVWAEVADFSSYGVKKITRFAFSPDKKRLAVVSNIE